VIIDDPYNLSLAEEDKRNQKNKFGEKK